MPTIIGAGAFHGPVRNGKGWDRPAMVARHNCLLSCFQQEGRIRSEGELSCRITVVLVIQRVKRKKKFVLGLIALDLQGYRVKPYGQLVSVSLTHYCASTPDLSTSWSSTTLQGGLASGRSHLQASFTLRCFQRLSLPHLATRRYDWRHNRYTRGASTPVLSY